MATLNTYPDNISVEEAIQTRVVADLAAINGEVGALAAGNVAWTYVAKTASYTVVASTDTYGTKIFTNNGATGTITFTLPAGANAMRVSFNVVDAYTLKVSAATGEKIRYAATQTAAAGYLQSATVGDFITLEWNGDEWVVVALVGHNWTDGTATLNIATSALKGKVELATDAECQTGTDTERAVTPAGAKASVQTWAKIAQMLTSTYATQTTGATTIPWDNSIPQQSTEGTEILTRAATPQNASSTLIITYNGFLGVGATGLNAIAALFQDATENAINAVSVKMPTSYEGMVTLIHIVSAASTDARTYKIKVGVPTNGTDNNIYINRDDAGGIFGGAIPISTLSVMEVLP